MKKAHPHSLAQARILAAHLNFLAESGHGEDPRRVDDDATNMLALSLEQMRSKVYETEYPELKARLLIPVAGDIDPGAETFAYEEQDYRGSAKIISDDGYADDPESVETLSRKVTHSVKTLGNAYMWTIQDLRRAAFSGRPLQPRKALAARRVFERGVDNIAAFGAPDDGIPNGFCNKDVGTSAGQIRGTAMTAASWDATPDAAGMVSDLNKAIADMIDASAETVEPDTLVLPIQQFLRLNHTFTSDGNPESALERFLKSNGFVKNVVPWNLMKGVDDGSNGSRGMLYKKDPDVLELVIPEEFSVLPPQPINFAFKQLCHGRIAGVCVYRPLGMRYLTGLPIA